MLPLGPEGDLVDLAGSLDREAPSPEYLLDCGDVLLHLADGAQADLAEDEDQGLRREGLVPALSLHYSSLSLQFALHLILRQGKLVASGGKWRGLRWWREGSMESV